MSALNENGRCRIVLTGGPGGGKSTAADMFRREIGDRLVVVPEAATILYGGGFPRTTEPQARRAAQQAIFHVQRNLEDVQSRLYPAELHRYDTVIHFETAAAGGIAIEGGNPVRNESLQEALALDQRLRSIWSQHPHFHVIPHNASFLAKITQALGLLQGLVAGFPGVRC